MSNYHTLTKKVDHEEFVAAMIAEGVTAGINIDHEKVTLGGIIWDAMDAAAQTAELVKVSNAEAAHTPTTLTKVSLDAAPHLAKFTEECLAVAGVDSVMIEQPGVYPGTGVVHHNSLSAGEQANLVAAAEAHDPTSVPSLSVDGMDPRVYAADDVTTGATVITDSRGAEASGKTVKVRIPAGGACAIDADSYVLDGLGQATINWQTTNQVSGEMEFEAYYANGEADPFKFIVKRGTV